MELWSPSFHEGDDIPVRFTCDGDDVSPSLEWTPPPGGTRAFAVVADDPDAPRGTWLHWTLYDLPGGERSLPEHILSSPALPSGAKQGRNDFGRVGYGGPCPPPGSTHRYHFRLFALDAPLGLPPGAGRHDLEHAMRGHVLAQAELIGRYQRWRR